MYIPGTIGMFILWHWKITDFHGDLDIAASLCYSSINSAGCRCSLVPVWCAPVKNTGTIYIAATGTIFSGNRHYVLRTPSHCLIPSVPSDFTGTINSTADHRHYHSTGTIEGQLLILSWGKISVRILSVPAGHVFISDTWRNGKNGVVVWWQN